MDRPSDPALTSGLIRARASALGFDSVGITAANPPESIAFFESWIAKGYHGTMGYLARSVALRASLDSLLPGCQSVIAVGLNYNQPNPLQQGMPRLARYALGRDYHKVLRGKLKRLDNWLGSLDQSHVGRVCVDSAPVLEREFAHRAGLGWFGKNTMLIDTRRGSWFVIGLLLTTLRLEQDEPAHGGCGTCRLCVEACPTGCILFEDGRWQIDARRCVSYLTIEHRGPFDPALQEGIGDWTFGCDVCQEVCPFNQPRHHQPDRANMTTEPDFLDRRDWPPLETLAVIQPADWDSVTRGSPVRRAGIDGIRRNASVNLKRQKPD
ncbi:MAG: tRNA epoxyqueuosine(34) reductase QueG [Fimbriimonadaceae bacterium]|nr:tRNA epoxyqueuosine(34) reductase QueG [Fimbriimonadaceae bacterium]QYK58418.1 MAG: tRNA epoxyqueuosine(34) reductase QueG [Fimbriimonadaceae bacterium]